MQGIEVQIPTNLDGISMKIYLFQGRKNYKRKRILRYHTEKESENRVKKTQKSQMKAPKLKEQGPIICTFPSLKLS